MLPSSCCIEMALATAVVLFIKIVGSESARSSSGIESGTLASSFRIDAASGPTAGKKRRISNICSRANFDFYDLLRENTTESNCGSDAIDLRHFTSLNSFLFKDGKPRQSTVDNAGAAALAVHHFNNGINDIVPQMKERADSCEIKFTIDFMDTQLSPIKASRALIDDILPRKNGADPLKPFPTALIGATRSAVSAPLAKLTGIHLLPQVSYASTSTVFDNKDEFPLFGRLVPSAIGDANAAVDYLHNILHVTHFGVLFVRDEYGATYAQAIKDAAWKVVPPMHVDISSFTFEAKEEEIADAVSQLKGSGFKYFVGIIFDYQYKLVMSEAYRQGIAGEGCFWMFGDASTSVRFEKFDSINEAGLVEATNGAAVVTAAFPSTREGRPEFEAFMRYWKNLTMPELRAYFHSKMPEGVIATNGYWSVGAANTTENTTNLARGHIGESHDETTETKESVMEEGIKFSEFPGPFTLLQYDTVIALAFAACDAAEQEKFFDGRMLYESFLRTSFNGLYGNVKIDEKTGSRDYTTLPYSVSNFIANPVDESGMVSFQLQPTDVYEEMKWKKIQPFVFSGGGTRPPDVLPLQEIDVELISVGAQSFGLVLCGITILLSLGFALWTFIHRNNEIIKASQPIFLGMLCLGSFLLGSAIIPMSLQEPIHQEGLDVACMMTPWLFSFGFIVAFSALFSKTMRVNQIFRSRGSQNRVAVKAVDVMKPFSLLFIANLALLISWTVVSPLTYYHVPNGSVDEFGRPSQFYATCAPEVKWWANWLFVVFWGAINISALLFANFQAYQGRCILTEYSETEYIGISMAVLLQSFTIGVPVMVVVDDSPTARHVVRCCLVFVTVVAVLLPIFIPKMIFLRQWRAHEKKMRKKLLLTMKKQRQMDALAVGDGSLMSWNAQQMAESSRISASSTDPQHVGLKIIAKNASSVGEQDGPRMISDYF